MKNIKIILISAFVCLFITSKAGVEPILTSKRQGSNIGVDSLITVTDDKYSCISASNCTPVFKTPVLKNAVLLGIDHDNTSCYQAYTFTVTLELEKFHLNTPTTGEKDTITLTLSWNPSAGVISQDKAVYNTEGYVKIISKILSYTSSLPSNAIPDNIYVENLIKKERYYALNYTGTSIAISSVTATQSDELTIAWAAVSGVEEYDFEYLYIDDFGDYNGSTVSYKSGAIIPVDFRNNATRVTVKGTSHAIKNLYQHGYLLFRVRFVGRDTVNYTQRLESRWSSYSFGNTVATYGTDNIDKYHITDNHEDTLNWQWTTSFAEEGKNKTVISYFDGSLRSRQMVTFTNTDRLTIVAESFYDHVGRKAVDALPVPTGDSIIKFYHNFNLSSYTQRTYSWKDFDTSASIASCNNNLTGMDTTSGASKYYSHNNNDKSLYQAYVPDAKQYPFVQVEFMPDNTGRVRKQSGVGYDHRMGSGHETQYFYGKPTQQELDMLFGVEVGNYNRYKKNMVVDPNGSISVSYLSPAGKVIATALAGENPSNLAVLPADTARKRIVENLSQTIPEIDSSGMTIKVTHDLLVTSSAQVDFDYKMYDQSLNMSCSPDICYDCIYDVKFSVTDICGIKLYDTTFIGVQPFDTICNNDSFEHSFSLALDKGSYRVYKELSVNLESLTYYEDLYLRNNACSRTVEEIYDSLVNEIDFTNCDNSCSACLDRLGTLSSYKTSRYADLDSAGLNIDSLESQFENEYNFYVDDCKALCDTPSVCEIEYKRLLQDVSPGGQYAKFSYDTANAFFTVDNLSLFDTTANNNFPSYESMARDFRNDSLTFFNSNGDTAFVWFDSAWVRPNDLPDSVFVDNWDPAWAYTLVKLHPEYCYYQWCILNESSNNFDLRLRLTHTYAEALADSLLDPLNIDPTTFTTAIDDPFFKTGGLGAGFKSAFVTAFNAYLSDGGATYDMWEAAAIITSCADEKSVAGINACLSANPFGSGSTTVKDLQWDMFRTLYLSKKQKYIDTVRTSYANSNSCANCYIGHDNQPLYSTSCTTVFTNDSFAKKQKQYPTIRDFSNIPLDSGTNLEIINKGRSYVTTAIENNCASQCAAYADNWMRSLAGCNASTMDSAALRDSLINICKLGCDQYNPLGSREVSPANTNLVTSKNFKEAIASFFTTNKLCNDALISFPLDYNHNYSDLDSVPIDSCFEAIVQSSITTFGCTWASEISALQSLLKDLADVGKFNITSEIGIKANVTSTTWEDYKNYLMSYTGGDSSNINNYTTYLTGNNLTVKIKSYNTDSLSCYVTIELPQGYTTGFYDSINSGDYTIDYIAPDPDYSKPFPYKEFIIYVLDDNSNTVQVKGNSTCYKVCSDTTPMEERVAADLNSLYCKNFTAAQVKQFIGVVYGDSLAVAYIPSDISCKPKCITCDKLYSANTSFWNEYGAIYTDSDSVEFDTNFIDVYANYVNSYLGFNQDYFAYKELKTNCDSFYKENTLPYYGYAKYRAIANGCDSLDEDRYDTLLNKLSLCDRAYAWVPDTISCDSSLKLQAYYDASTQYKEELDTLKGNFRRQYLQKCMNNIANIETFNMSYDIKQYHYTLYYYDQADNLVKTVPPAGVRLITNADTLAMVVANRNNKVAANYYNTPHHILGTNYKYNTLNGVYEQTTPDAGTSTFYYDRLGRLAVSQNQEQYGQAGSTKSQYSYTYYDELGRITEVGETKNLTSMDDATCRSSSLLASWHSSAVWHQEITRSYYDTKQNDVNEQFEGGGQQNLRNRVAYTSYDEDGTGNYDYASYYSYDIHGNVKELVHDYADLQAVAFGYFKLKYEYDLISGNVNKVSYQAGKQDQFYHEYVYDGDNRINQVFTSRDDILRDNDAKYYYYQHGPLARAEIGELKVQGMDYAYTIHGWLKGVNSGSLDSSRDIGKDGWWDAGNTRRYIPKDEYGFTLGYYDGDYTSIGQHSTAQHFEVAVSGGFNVASPSLYNGNIRHMVTAIGKFMEGGSGLPMGYAYKYDHLNRLASMNAYDSINLANNVWYSGATAMSQYRNSFTYDANGNILTQMRNGATSINEAMDSLVYHYYPGTNRLGHVSDVVNSGNYGDDIDDQDTLNYRYDLIGNLVYDAAEGIDTIEWNVYGKITRIVRDTGSTKPNLEFSYGAGGNRVAKRVTYPNDTANRSHIEYYVRDAQGNTMATYTTSDPYFEPIDTSYEKIISKLIDSMGLSSFAGFVQARFASDTAFYNRLGTYIPDSVLIDSFTVDEIVNCTGDELISKMFSCCDTCVNYAAVNIMWNTLDNAAANSISLVEELLNCKTDLVINAIMMEDDSALIAEIGSSARYIMYTAFRTAGYIHNNSSSGDTLHFLLEDVPRSELVSFMADSLAAGLVMSQSDYIESLADVINGMYATIGAAHAELGKYISPCSFMDCLGRCLQNASGTFADANTNATCSGISSSNIVGWYTTYIGAWDNEPDIAGYRDTLSMTVGEWSNLSYCAEEKALLVYLKAGYGTDFFDFLVYAWGIDEFANYAAFFVDRYPPASLPITDYQQYLLDYVPLDELVLYIRRFHTLRGDWGDVLDAMADYCYSSTTLDSDDFKTFLDDCTYRRCIIGTGIQSFAHTAYSFKQYIQTKTPLRDFVHSKLQQCYSSQYNDKLVQSLVDRTSYSTMYGCGTRITQFGFDKYIYDSLINQIAHPNMITQLGVCDIDTLLYAAGHYNIRQLITAIASNSPSGTNYLNSACSTFSITYTNPGLGCHNYLAQIVPLDSLLAHIRANYTGFVADVANHYSQAQMVEMISQYYPVCDFKTCMWNKVNDGTLAFDSSDLMQYTKDNYWPYMMRKLYECNADTFTLHAAYTRPHIIAKLFEDWHYPLADFMTEVETHYNSTVRNLLDVDTIKKVQYLWVNEWHMYGSSRLGVYQAQNDTVVGVKRSYDHRVSNDTVSIAYFAIDTLNYNKFAKDSIHYLHKGLRRYEGTNHLGNVLVVFTDKRIKVCSHHNTIHYYRADVVNAYEYSPFGAILPDRMYVGDTLSLPGHYDTLIPTQFSFVFNIGGMLSSGDEIHISKTGYDNALAVYNSSYTTLQEYIDEVIANAATFGLTAQDLGGGDIRITFGLNEDYMYINCSDVVEVYSYLTNTITTYEVDCSPVPTYTPPSSSKPTSYRFGFNGMEKDNSIKGTGNSYDFGARIYDSRLGRFLSVDPKWKIYDKISPYCFAGNSPILFIDYNGEGPQLPPQQYVEAIKKYNENLYVALWYSNNTSNLELYKWSKGESKDPNAKNKLVGAFGEAIAKGRIANDFSAPFPYIGVPAPVTALGYKYSYGGQTYQVDVTSYVFTGYVNILGIPSFTAKAGIRNYSFDGTENKMAKYGGKKPEFYRINYEVKTLSPMSDVESLYNNISEGINQTIDRGQGKNVIGVLVVDKAAWIKVANDPVYGPQLRTLYNKLTTLNKSENESNYLRLEENLSSEANSGLYGVKDAINKTDAFDGVDR